MPTYTHESGGQIVTVPGSPLHRQMIAKAADPGSGWALDGPSPAGLDSVSPVDPERPDGAHTPEESP